MKKINILYIVLITLFLTSCNYNSEETIVKENDSIKKTSSVEQTILDSKNSKVTNISFTSIDTSEFQNLLCNGVYKCGVDFEPGNYYIVSLYGAESGYDISDSSDDFMLGEYKIIRKINVKKGQYIKFGDAILIPEEKIDINNWKKYGVFAVGKDLPAGEYRIKGLTDKYYNNDYGINIQGSTLSAYQIFNDSPANSESITSKFLFKNQEYITLKDGQYIAITNLILTLVE